jgi:hypothetical protein
MRLGLHIVLNGCSSNNTDDLTLISAVGWHLRLVPGSIREAEGPDRIGGLRGVDQKLSPQRPTVISRNPRDTLHVSQTLARGFE